MKAYILCGALLLFSAIATSQSFNKEITPNGKSPRLLGKINQDGLSSNSYGTWFTKNKEAYTPDSEIINQLEGNLADYTIEAFMGTWCGDSKREVPRMYKVLEAAGFDLDRLTMVGVNTGKEQYKKSPGGEHEGKVIHRVPTFIIKKNGIEQNRIVESPVTTLEEDLLNIVKNNYIPNHEVVQQAAAALKTYGPEKLVRKAQKISKELKPQAKNMYQLNTYGNVLYLDNKVDEAIAILTVNTHLYPKEAGVFRSLGNKLLELERLEESLAHFKTALELDPNNEKTKKTIEEITSRVQ